jgi:D-alanyl-D-alanine carboxypeptidase (penicillin-binding protein 5/6)
MKKIYTKTRLIFSLMILSVLPIVQAEQIFTISREAYNIPAPPKINAASYILIDADTGIVLGEQQADKRVEPASTTKIMTSYLVDKTLQAGKIHEDDLVSISANAERAEGSRMYLKADTSVPLDVLHEGMVVVSGNDASIALAEHISGDTENFSVLMNEQAKSLGMKNSNYVNPNGLPAPKHYTTARDMAILGRAVIHDFPETYSQYSQASFSYNGFKKDNSNALLKQKNGVDGIKTGYTRAAKYCLVASAKRGDMRLIAVVMGAKSIKSRNDQIMQLFSYGFENYETHQVYAADSVITTLPIKRGEKEEFTVGVMDDIYITIPRGAYQDVESSISVPNYVLAPVEKDQRFGDIVFTWNDETLAESQIYAQESVDKGSWWQNSKQYLSEIL